MSRINELWHLPQLIYSYTRNERIQRRFMSSTIEKTIADVWRTNDGSLSDKDLRKIRKYYGNAVPAILGEAFAILRNKELSKTERETQTYLGGLTGLFDDLFDEKKIEGERLLEMIRKPEESLAQSSFELLFLKFYIRALSLADPGPIIKLLLKGYYAQVGSNEQMETDITQKRIAQVTREKGGVFLQFYRSGFDGEPSELENDMLYNIGAVGQLENDIFDLYKDHQDGIKTLASTCSSIVALEQTYLNWIEKYKSGLAALPVDAKAKNRFERFTRILYLRGLVCLDQYKKLEARYEAPFEVSNYKREELICDMEKAKNQWKLMGLYLKG